MALSREAYLVDVVEVDRANRIRCQAQGCGHAVYARIHVVLDEGQFVVLGGDCFQRLYGGALKGAKSYYGGSASEPTRLSDEMRLLLETNTAEFVENLERRRLQLEAELANRKIPVTRQDELSKSNVLPKHAAEKFATAILGQYQYAWSANWWKSSGQLLADVRAALARSPHIDVVYRAVVGMVRQPAITPVDFATRLELNGVSREAVLDCLHALRLVVRRKLPDSAMIDSETRLRRMRELPGMDT